MTIPCKIKLNMKCIAILIIFCTTLSYGQNASYARYKAMFTLNFMKYIGWPEEAKQRNFVIGVVRDSELTRQLKDQTRGKKFGYQDIVIKEFKNVDDIQNCQILYFSDSMSFSRNAALVKQKLGGKNSLIITESEGAINEGSMINFVIRDGKLKFELSNANAGKSGIKFSSSLTSLSNAIVVN